MYPSYPSKCRSLLLLFGVMVLLFTCTGKLFSKANAQDIASDTPASEPVVTETPVIEVINPYFSIEYTTLLDGTTLSGYIINGPLTPPPQYEAERASSLTPIINAIVLPDFPSYNWVFGCSSVSGAMIAAYYDRGAYPNMYLGPTNGGVMPVTDTSWPTWSDGYASYPNNPLIASKNGVDGSITPGSIDDYWVKYGSASSDPYITNGWTQHTWGTAIGDYMKTSQSAYGNSDGSTAFYGYPSNAKLTCSAMEGGGIANRDGTYGRKLFFEARGYSVGDCYNQKTDNNVSGGFSLANFQAEIDAGYPVLLNLEGHSIVGYGYEGSTIYIRDTWSSNPNYTPTMPWGGSYSGMKLLTVSIVHPITGNVPGSFSKSAPLNAASNVSANPTLSWGTSSAATSYEYCYDTTNDNACSSWTSTGTTSNVVLSGLSLGTTYYWQIRSVNGTGTTYADGSSSAFWSFTTGNVPGSFSKSAPLNSATNVSTNPTLSWGTSSVATSYEYCYDTTNDNACSSWTSTGTTTNVALSGLSLGTTYYWQIRSVNGTGTTYADGSSTAFWSFTTGNVPGSFSKSTPLNSATNVSTNPTLSWGTSNNATSYEYCYDTSNDNACSSWTSTGTTSNVALSGLSLGTTYYWQIRSVNGTGTTYADGLSTAIWSFTTPPIIIYLPILVK